MGLDRSKFKNIVGGITTPVSPEASVMETISEPAAPTDEQAADSREEQGGPSPDPAAKTAKPATVPTKRFAKTGRPKGQGTGKTTKAKVSLFIDKNLIDELYDWAYQDRIQPGELFERALRTYRDREAKRRNGGTE